MTQISLFAGSADSSQSNSRPLDRAHQPSQIAFFGHVGVVIAALQEWQERNRSRRDLMRLSEHQLKDIGLSRFDAEEEYGKPFWRE